MHPAHALIAAAVSGFGLWQFLRHLRRDRMVADTPLAHIRSAAQGYVKLTGTALPPGATPTRAPLTNRDCVWWQFQVSREERGPKNEVRWETVENGASVEPFVLEENGARCLVGPVKADITPTDSKTWRDGDLKYSERVIEVGAHLCVMGELRSHSDTGDLEVATQQKLRDWKADQETLLKRFDADHDGRLNIDEWETARAAAAREAQAETLASGIARTSVVSEPLNGEPFLIGPLDTRQLENRERIQAGLYLALALLGLYVCGYALTHA